MRRMVWLGGAALYCGWAVTGFGQMPVRISDNVAMQHLLPHEEAAYPAAAKAGHVTGTVILDVTIDGTGKVVGVKVIDGPAMLVAGALAAVKTWRYKPFEEAAGKAVSTYVSLPFAVEKTAEEVARDADQKVAGDVARMDVVCLSSLKARSEFAVKECREEVQFALGFADQSFRFLETMRAHRNLGYALLADDKAGEALGEFEAENVLAKRWLHDTDIESVTPLVDRAQAEEVLNEMPAALADYSEAEAIARRAILDLSSMGRPYRYTLQQVLLQHAGLLTKLHRDDEAAGLRLEAGSLSEPASR